MLEQRSDYDRILLPVLGMGEQIEIEANRLNVDRVLYATRPGSAWLFTPVRTSAWLHVPLRALLSQIRNTWVLLDGEQTDADVLSRVRPPMVPKLRESLAALDWWVADYGGRDGGRMSRGDFLTEIRDQPWIRFNHNPVDGTADLESWRGSTLLSGWTTSVLEHFRLDLPWKRPDAPCSALNWALAPGDAPFDAVISVFLLDDPYELMRCYVLSEHGFDPDLLGPLTVWKDLPDLLQEFSDRHDQPIADLCAAVADRLGADEQAIRRCLDTWFTRIAREGCTEFPTLGEIHRVELPDVRIPRPVPLARDEAGGDVVVSPGHVHAATALPADTWVRSVKRRERSSGA